MVRGQDPIRRRLRRKVSSANDEEISKPTQCKPAVGQRTRSGYGPFEPPAANCSPGYRRSYFVHIFVIKGIICSSRLMRTCRLMLRHAGKSALQILGAPDDLKFRSCLTLFAQPASNDDDRCLIKQALDQFYEGGPDPLTENWQGRIDQARSLNSARRSAAVRPSRRKNKSSNCCFQKNG
jgi:hypothetical protein